MPVCPYEGFTLSPVFSLEGVWCGCLPRCDACGWVECRIGFDADVGRHQMYCGKCGAKGYERRGDPVRNGSTEHEREHDDGTQVQAGTDCLQGVYGV